jgi:hypothetical protein
LFQFSNDEKKFAQANSHLDHWPSHKDPQKQRKNALDPVTFGQDLQLTQSPYRSNFEPSATEIAKFYESKKSQLEAVERMLQ